MDTTDSNQKELACTAYEAYAESANWKNFRGELMPQWHELPEDIRKHWRATARKIYELLVLKK